MGVLSYMHHLFQSPVMHLKAQMGKRWQTGELLCPQTLSNIGHLKYKNVQNDILRAWSCHTQQPHKQERGDGTIQMRICCTAACLGCYTKYTYLGAFLWKVDAFVYLKLPDWKWNFLFNYRELIKWDELNILLAWLLYYCSN